MVFRQRSFDGNEAAKPLAQAGDAVVLGACDEDQRAGNSAFNGIGNAQFVQAAMATGKDERRRISFSLGPRRDRGQPHALQRTKIRAKALHGMDRSLPAFGETKSRLGAEKQGARILSRYCYRCRLEGME